MRACTSNCHYYIRLTADRLEKKMPEGIVDLCITTHHHQFEIVVFILEDMIHIVQIYSLR